jgi:adenine-specific DNA glycosylase
MWEFPAVVVEAGEEDRGATARALATELGAGRTGYNAEAPLAVLPEVRHAFTHLHITYRPVLLEASGGAVPGHEWAGAEELAALALPTAMRRIANEVWERLGETSAARVAAS